MGYVMNNITELTMSELFNILRGDLGQDTVLALARGSLAFSVLLFLVAFLGCCGARSKSTWMLYGYVALVGLFILAQLIIGGITFGAYQNLPETLEELWNADSVSVEDRTFLENRYECCGFNGPNDNPGACETGATVGCKEPLIAAVKDTVQADALAAVAIVFGVIQLVSVFLA